jgi:peptide/nickel transport system substrate-binding protein
MTNNFRSPLDVSRRQLLTSTASAAAAMALAGVPLVAFGQTASGSELVVIAGADISTLDPFKTNAHKDLSLITAITNRLTRMSKTNYGEVEPLLATAWESVEPDRWRITLRDGVKFHNGNAFNAKLLSGASSTMLRTRFSKQ